MTRYYVYQVNWVRLFAWSVVFGFLSLAAAVFFLAALFDPTFPDGERIAWGSGGLLAAPLFFTLCVGAARNGYRVLHGSVKAHYGWKE